MKSVGENFLWFCCVNDHKLLLLYPVYSSLLQAACLCHGTATVALHQAVSGFRSAPCISFWEHQDEGHLFSRPQCSHGRGNKYERAFAWSWYLATSTYIPASQWYLEVQATIAGAGKPILPWRVGRRDSNGVLLVLKTMVVNKAIG